MKLEVFQSFIDAISSAFSRDDFALWRDHVRLPVSFVTQNGVVTLDTAAELRANYDGHMARFHAAGVTEIRRTVRSLEMLDPTQAIATYDTDILRGDELVYQPYTSSMLLSWERADGWRCTIVMNALASDSPKTPPGLEAPRRTPEDAMEIYQTHLDVVNEILLTPQLPDLCDHVAFPAEFGTLDAKTRVTDCGEIHRLMDRFVKNIRQLGMTDYIRIAQSAKFTSATRIEGLHETHILRSGTHVTEPYKCEGALDFIDGQWRVSYGMSEIYNHMNGLIAPEFSPIFLPDKMA